MSDATKRKCGCDWSLWETCDECNPDDEAAEIRRLRTRLAESEGEVGRLTRESEDYREKRANEVEHYKAMASAQRAYAAALASALDDLIDWQNGPPLITYTEGWTAAMAQAEKALANWRDRR